VNSISWGNDWVYKGGLEGGKDGDRAVYSSYVMSRFWGKINDRLEKYREYCSN
jgi:hypothetical protein